jgi:hypothetical protein
MSWAGRVAVADGGELDWAFTACMPSRKTPGNTTARVVSLCCIDPTPLRETDATVCREQMFRVSRRLPIDTNAVCPGAREERVLNRLLQTEMENTKRQLEKHLQQKGKFSMGIKYADVAELVDARDLKSLGGSIVRVRVPPPAPWISRLRDQ